MSSRHNVLTMKSPFDWTYFEATISGILVVMPLLLRSPPDITSHNLKSSSPPAQLSRYNPPCILGYTRILLQPETAAVSCHSRTSQSNVEVVLRGGSHAFDAGTDQVRTTMTIWNGITCGMYQKSRTLSFIPPASRLSIKQPPLSPRKSSVLQTGIYSSPVPQNTISNHKSHLFLSFIAYQQAVLYPCH